MKKHRTDTAHEAVKTMVNAAKGELMPPAHVRLRDCDWPFWLSVVNARARDRWNDADLELAANLARCKADIERIHAELEEEGDTIKNDRGTMIVNPKHTLLETLNRRAVALSKALQVHAEATQGKSREQVKANKAQKSATETLKKAAKEGLIARPH